MRRHLLNNKKDYCGVAPLQDNGITYNDPQGKLNKAFSSVFMHKNVSSMPVLTDTYPNVPCRSIQFTSEGILHLLLDLKPNKAPGPDRIPAHLLKEQAYELVLVLAILYKANMEQECLPTK